MERWPLRVAFAAALAIASSAAVPRVAGDSPCVECHRRPETIRALPRWRQDQFLHWYGSVHGRHGVTCEKCHGGDPERIDRDLMHEGILPSSDAHSRVYYKNLPETCGACHDEVYRDFTRSRHFDELKGDRLAPSCTTCHGFQMDIGEVDMEAIAGRCEVCHASDRGTKPWVSRRTREIARAVKGVERAMRRAQAAVDLAEEGGVAPAEAAAALHAARQRLRRTGAFWHRFELAEFKRELDAILWGVEATYRAARRAITGK